MKFAAVAGHRFGRESIYRDRNAVQTNPANAAGRVRGWDLFGKCIIATNYAIQTYLR